MFGALEFSDKMAASGIQPIIGWFAAIDFGDQENGLRQVQGPAREFPRLVLLAMNDEGYRNLMQLSSRAFLDVPANERPHLKLAALEANCEGLIALTGGPSGPLDQAIASGQKPMVASRCATLERLFGDRLYIELQRHGLPIERAVEPQLIELAYARGIPLVATNQ